VSKLLESQWRRPNGTESRSDREVVANASG